MDVGNLVSLAGIPVLLLLAWALSTDRRNLNLRVVLWGIGLQLAIAALVFSLGLGTHLFTLANRAVVGILDSATAGAEFAFGRLAVPPGGESAAGEPSLGFILAFQALPTILFFSALMALLYHFGVMQRIIGAFSWVFTKLMRISGAESLAASSNIFVGVESALTVKPYLAGMTRSELNTMLTAMMATVSSNVLAVYVFSLQGNFPSIAGHLVIASVLSAPAALAVSKLLVPETDTPETLGRHVPAHHEKAGGVFEAVIRGANDGVRLVVGIVALLVAVLGLVALADLVLGGVGGPLNQWLGISVDWSLRGLLGYVFYPIVLVLGVPVADAGLAAQIIGERTVVTELTAYVDLDHALASGAFTDPRTPVIVAYALCGFAHVASLAIFVGGVAALAPGRTGDLAKLGFRALIGATIACLTTACVAGAFYREGTFLLGG